MQSSLVGWPTVCKCSLCQTLWRLSSLHCSWGVDLKSDTAACCVYIPMHNTLVWLSEWIIPRLTFLPGCRADRGCERLFSVRYLLQLKIQLSNKIGLGIVCECCGSLSCDVTWLVYTQPLLKSCTVLCLNADHPGSSGQNVLDISQCSLNPWWWR